MKQIKLSYKKLFIFVSIAWAILFLPTLANCYVLMYTGDLEDKVVKWDTNCFYYTINEEGAPNVDLNILRETIRESFDQWEDQTCSYFYFEETEPGSCEEAGFNEFGGNTNLLLWKTSNW